MSQIVKHRLDVTDQSSLQRAISSYSSEAYLSGSMSPWPCPWLDERWSRNSCHQCPPEKQESTHVHTYQPALHTCFRRAHMQTSRRIVHGVHNIRVKNFFTSIHSQQCFKRSEPAMARWSSSTSPPWLRHPYHPMQPTHAHNQPFNNEMFTLYRPYKQLRENQAKVWWSFPLISTKVWMVQESLGTHRISPVPGKKSPYLWNETVMTRSVQ